MGMSETTFRSADVNCGKVVRRVMVNDRAGRSGLVRPLSRLFPPFVQRSLSPKAARER